MEDFVLFRSRWRRAKARKSARARATAGCDGNYWESVRNSLRRCRCGGGSGSRAARRGPRVVG